MTERDRRWAAVHPHRERLLRIARARLDDPHDAEDCVQEAMLRAVEFAALDEERLGQFLTSVTVRLCADVHRGRARGERLSRRLTGFWGTDPGHEESVCDRAESVWLSGRLADLTPKQRAIVDARAEGLSCGAVAERLLVPYTTVESSLARVRRSLRGALESTLGVTALPSWLRLRRVLYGGAAAAALTVTAGGVDLPELRDRPVPRGPVPVVAAAAAPRAEVPAPRRTAATAARRDPVRVRAARAAAAPPVAARPRVPYDGTSRVYVDGLPPAGRDGAEHGYSDPERVGHCVRYGVAVGETVQCRYPPGHPNNVDEYAGTPRPERHAP